MQYGFVIDHEKCIGCHACTVACKSENDVPVGNFRTWVKYTEIGTFPAVKRHFAVLRCNHCTNAPCVTICPVNALEKRADGIVDLNRDVCIGCKSCIQACPYDALYLHEETGSVEKCHYCAHRVEQNLEPACVVVCPEQAIISGDLHDPNSQISQMSRREDAVVRRPEQETGPNVFYVGTDPVSLKPGTAAEPETYLWSERRLPPPDWPAEHDVYPNARTVLDVNHDIYWGWKISFYLVTKGIAGGVAMLAPFVLLLGMPADVGRIAPEILALVFVGITSVLLVADLKRPTKFITLLTRPNTRSWLVKGAWALMAFTGLSALALGVRWLGNEQLANLLRLPNVFAGALTAGYTAFLFAQCEGRDLWQNTTHMLVHLLAQALMLGAFALLAVAPSVSLAVIALIGSVVHAVVVWLERTDKHKTDNARQAALLLPRVPAWRGSKLSALMLGTWLPPVAAGLATVLAAGNSLQPTLAFVLALAAACGLFFYEQALLRAGQTPPLS